LYRVILKLKEKAVIRVNKHVQIKHKLTNTTLLINDKKLQHKILKRAVTDNNPALINLNHDPKLTPSPQHKHLTNPGLFIRAHPATDLIQLKVLQGPSGDNLHPSPPAIEANLNHPKVVQGIKRDAQTELPEDYSGNTGRGGQVQRGDGKGKGEERPLREEDQ